MRKLGLFLILLLVVAVGSGLVAAQDDDGSQFIGEVEAPAFPPDLDWLNVENPLRLEGLRGKIVLLDFWTYGCINCIHMLPVLERLEEKYAEELVIISVHSAKFDTEGETQNIRQVVQRYDITHPVINDHQFRVWQTYRARAWPTFTVIDPRGNVLAQQAGEIPFEAFDRLFSNMVAFYDERGEIDRTPLDLALEGAGDPGTALLYPGKVLADPVGNRLFIADSNHHRIVITDLSSYEVLDIIGTGRRGLDDGGYDEATFNKPQGMALEGDTLYVADTNNHAIRAVDLESGSVSTLAGTGEMGRRPLQPGETADDPLQTALRSPWDVTMGATAETLFIAMAGTHQIWTLDLSEDTLSVAVGNGREALLNDSLLESELAQPSGLHFVDNTLYFADSESSSIRAADFTDDAVRTLAGPAENTLFDFGDRDGEVGTSRLQHPLGITGGPDSLLFIADTYNSRIKQVNPETTVTSTLLGLGGEGGFQDGGPDVAAFDEPGGLDYADGRLYVADTNNHAIRVVDLASETVETVTFPNPEALRIDEESVTVLGGNTAEGARVTLDAQTVRAGDGEVVLQITLPEGFVINDLIDSTLALQTEGETVTVESARVTVDETEVHIPATFSPGEGALNADLTLYYCRYDEQSLCFIDEVAFDAPLTVSEDADGSTVTLSRTVTPPEVSE